jgi:hypothetical protein
MKEWNSTPWPCIARGSLDSARRDVGRHRDATSVADMPATKMEDRWTTVSTVEQVP